MPTTPNGTTYTVRPFTSSAGEPCWRAVDDTKTGATKIPTVLFCHGNPGTDTSAADQQFTQNYTTLRNWLIDNGWAYIEGHGAGANWGNQAGRNAYEAMFTATVAAWSIGKVIVIGRSMGALVGAWLASQSTVVAPYCAGFVSLSGTANLSDRYSTAGTTDRTNLEAAYGVTGETAFRAAVANYDPMLVALSAWDGRNAIMQWDTSDTTVPYAVNGQAWDTKYGPQLAIRRTQSTSGGDHNSTPNDAAHNAATISFLEAVNVDAGTWRDTWSDTWGPANASVSGTLPLSIGIAGTRTVDTTRTGGLVAGVAISGTAVANVTRTAELAFVTAITATRDIDTSRTGGVAVEVSFGGLLETGTITRSANITLALGISATASVDVARTANVALSIIVAGVVTSSAPPFPDTLTLTASIDTLTLAGSVNALTLTATVPELTLEVSWM